MLRSLQVMGTQLVGALRSRYLSRRAAVWRCSCCEARAFRLIGKEHERRSFSLRQALWGGSRATWAPAHTSIHSILKTRGLLSPAGGRQQSNHGGQCPLASISGQHHWRCVSAVYRHVSRPELVSFLSSCHHQRTLPTSVGPSLHCDVALSSQFVVRMICT